MGPSCGLMAPMDPSSSARAGAGAQDDQRAEAQTTQRRAAGFEISYNGSGGQPERSTLGGGGGSALRRVPRPGPRVQGARVNQERGRLPQ